MIEKGAIGVQLPPVNQRKRSSPWQDAMLEGVVVALKHESASPPSPPAPPLKLK